jgi:hypothetical protein
MSGAEMKIAFGYDVRFAIKACRAAAKVMGREPGRRHQLLRKNRGQGPEELERRDVLSSCL